LIDRLAHADIVILNELGYLPLLRVGGALPFHLLINIALPGRSNFSANPGSFFDATQHPIAVPRVL
jgi:hypothetical protein